jgi:hypothetical protein
MSKVVFVQLLNVVPAVIEPTAIERFQQDLGRPQTLYGLLKAANDNHLAWPFIPFESTKQRRPASVTAFQVAPAACHSRRSDRMRLRDVADWHEADLSRCPQFGRFSNRLIEVNHFQTTHYCSVDVTRGLVLLFGIGA